MERKSCGDKEVKYAEEKKGVEEKKGGPAGPPAVDYRVEGRFCDLELRSRDGEVLYYSRHRLCDVPAFVPLLVGPGLAPGRAALDLDLTTSAANRFLGWVSRGRTAAGLSDLPLPELLELGRAGARYQVAELVQMCLGAVTLPLGSTFEDVWEVVRFAGEAKADLKAVASRWICWHSTPVALPKWPREFWASCLQCEPPTLDARRTQLAISIHSGVMPSDWLLKAVAEDVAQLQAEKDETLRASRREAYWKVFELTQASTGLAADTWRQKFLQLAYSKK